MILNLARVKQLFFLALLSEAILCSSCGEKEELVPEVPAVPVTEIAFSKPVVSVGIGTTRKLKAILSPGDASDRRVVWSSNNTDIATVSKGVVTGVKEGEAVVTIKTVDGGKTATCTVKVVSELTYYAEGDLYPDAVDPVGVVFWIEPATVINGRGYEGKVVSLDESNKIWGRSGVAVHTTSVEDGAMNMATIKTIPDWENKYPAFKWCADKGEKWYLPASGELFSLYRNRDIVNTAILRVARATAISDLYYWASTEYDESPKTLAGCLFFRDATIDDWASKSGQNGVRAVFTF